VAEDDEGAEGTIRDNCFLFFSDRLGANGGGKKEVEAIGGGIGGEEGDASCRERVGLEGGSILSGGRMCNSVVLFAGVAGKI
jgi:hypothetical protein